MAYGTLLVKVDSKSLSFKRKEMKILANNYLVFREEGRTVHNIAETYAHNERTKDFYYNNNIKLDLSSNNYYFKRPTETYLSSVQRRLNSGELSDKGLKKDDAHYFSEVLVGINREYWYGKSKEEIVAFFKAAYDYIKGRFGEENILSAVIHCDEISPAIIDGKEVELVNYHMHIVGIPTTTKHRFFTKRSKEYKELAEQVGEKNILKEDKRLLKSSEIQISHSAFFKSGKDENHRISYSYSVWQDEIMSAIKNAGYTDIHRGVTNQKAVHIHPMAYKQIMQKIKEEADGCLPDFVPQPVGDDKYLIDKEELVELGIAKEKIEQEIASYDLAVEALVEEQKRVYERQHLVYVNEIAQHQFDYERSEYECLKEEAERLREENKILRSAINFIKDKIQHFINCFQKIVNSWITLRTNPDADAMAIMQEIDNHIKTGIDLINNKEMPDGIIEIR